MFDLSLGFFRVRTHRSLEHDYLYSVHLCRSVLFTTVLFGRVCGANVSFTRRTARSPAAEWGERTDRATATTIRSTNSASRDTRTAPSYALFADIFVLRTQNRHCNCLVPRACVRTPRDVQNRTDAPSFSCRQFSRQKTECSFLFFFSSFL